MTANARNVNFFIIKMLIAGFFQSVISQVTGS